MLLFVNELLSSVIQLILFGIIPFIWWLATARKKVGFLQWIGLKRSDFLKTKKLFGWIICTVLGFWAIGELSLYMLKDVETAASVFTGLGVQAIPAVVIYAVIHTALSEEILFRGFLLKRIANKFKFKTGNAIQALLFGLVHGGLFFSETGFIKAFLLVLFTASIAWVMGYINEKKAGVSILPSWIIHGITNILSGLAEAF